MNTEALVNELQTLVTAFGQDLKEADLTREPFNLFTTLLSHDDEVRLHTRFLHCLLDPNGTHGGGIVFLRAFFAQLTAAPPVAHDGSSVDVSAFPWSVWSVERDVGCADFGNLDLLLFQPGFAIVIENKTRLHEQPEQLMRYAHYLRAKHNGQRLLLFLTPHGSQSATAGGETYYRISYRHHILPWLEKCLVATLPNEAFKPILGQYRDVVKELVGQTPESFAMNQLVEKILLKGDLIRHREKLKDALDHARVRVLAQLAETIRSGLKEYAVISLSGREFESRADGILEIKPLDSSWVEAPFKICLQYWSEKSMLILGLECTDQQANDRGVPFDRMKPALLLAKFTKTGSYSTWPVGWVPLVTGFNDEKLADFVGGSDELRAPLIVSIKDSLRAIETAYGGALEAARTDFCLGKVPAKSPPT
jgi:hypothetical protein